MDRKDLRGGRPQLETAAVPEFPGIVVAPEFIGDVGLRWREPELSRLHPDIRFIIRPVEQSDHIPFLKLLLNPQVPDRGELELPDAVESSRSASVVGANCNSVLAFPVDESLRKRVDAK